jgi:hypothetical protein
MTLLFNEIARKQYRTFARMAPEKATQHVEVIKYIEGIARTAGIDISLWDAKRLFGTGQGNELIMDKSLINRIFFEEMERLHIVDTSGTTATDNPVPVPVLTGAQQVKIKALETQLIQNEKDRLAREHRGALDNALSRYRDFEECLRKAWLVSQQVNNLEGGPRGRVSITEQITNIASGNFWTLKSVDDSGNVRFVCKDNVFIEYRNPAASIDYRVNTGKFEVIYNIMNTSLKVVKSSQNIVVDDYYHPHINSFGHICWGSAANEAAKLLSQGNLESPINILATILTNYNPSSPYKDISAFAAKYVSPEELEQIASFKKASLAIDRLFVDATNNANWDLEGIPRPVSAIAEQQQAVTATEAPSVHVGPIVATVSPVTPEEIAAEQALINGSQDNVFSEETLHLEEDEENDEEYEEEE